MSGEKYLVVNADDFGFTRDVNAGIIEAHTRGILTATTLMANGAAFEDALRLAQQHPALDIGAHLVLIGGHSLRPPYAAFPRTSAQLVQTLLQGKLNVYEELRAQIEKIRAAGLRPTHLDTHKHTHLLPPVLTAVARLAREYGIFWVRRPFDFTAAPLPGYVSWSKRLTHAGMRGLRPYLKAVLQRSGCAFTDYFSGFQITGQFHAQQLVELLRHLPVGTTEFMCHPGHCGAELQAAPTRLKQSRAEELAALIAPEVRAVLAECGIRLVSYPGLPRPA